MKEITKAVPLHESELENVCASIDDAFKNYDSIKEKAKYYGDLCLEAADDLSSKILNELK